jgi:uncharacterized membrane protein
LAALSPHWDWEARCLSCAKARGSIAHRLVLGLCDVFRGDHVIWITGIRPGQFSPIHLLSILTLVTLPFAI